MIDLNEMIIEQLKERDASFPDVTKGVLVAMVIIIPFCITFFLFYLFLLILCIKFGMSEKI